MLSAEEQAVVRTGALPGGVEGHGFAQMMKGLETRPDPGGIPARPSSSSAADPTPEWVRTAISNGGWR